MYNPENMQRHELLPVYDVVIKLNGFKVENASLPFQNVQLEVDGEHATITVPRVYIHEVILLGLGKE